MSGKPAVFLDRDGVLTVEKGYICPIKEIRLFPYAAECIREIHSRGYFSIVITNQSGVARGIFTEDQLIKVHKNIMKETGVDAIYYCPHHADGSIKKYAIQCDCRKPEIGLLRKACLDFNIDMSKSYLVGDRPVDILTGKNAGIKTVLLLNNGVKNRDEKIEIEPDYIFKDLRDIISLLK